MAIAAGDFLSVHLAVIVRILNISEHLAGVTIFAFGNGSSDLFSTLTAMNSNNGGLAITELFGATAFITTVVLGLVSTIQPFYVDPDHFIGDIVWLIIAASMLLTFLADGRLVLGECLGIIDLYIAFVCFALLRPQGSVAWTRLQSTSENSRAHQGLEDSIENLPDNPNSDANSRTRVIGVVPTESFITSVRSQQDASRQPLLQNSVADDNGYGLPTASILSQQQSDSSFEPIYDQSVLGMFPPLTSWNGQSIGEKVLIILSLPILVPIGLTTPMVQSNMDNVDEMNSQNVLHTSEIVGTSRASPIQIATSSATRPQQQRHPSPFQLLTPRWCHSLQLILGPQFLAIAYSFQIFRLVPTNTAILEVCSTSLIISALLGILYLTNHSHPTNRLSMIYNLSISILSFTTSLTWIYLIVTLAVTLIATIGFILKLPTAILGATIFVIGNSSSDFVTNTAVARRGFPILAASICYGGPMMNMLLGIEIGGLIQVLKERKNTTTIPKSGPESYMYSFQISPGTFVSAFSLLIGLGMTLAYVFYSSWKLDRKLGMGLIGIWSVSTFAIIGLSLED